MANSCAEGISEEHYRLEGKASVHYYHVPHHLTWTDLDV